jgi:hypothetical protein
MAEQSGNRIPSVIKGQPHLPTKIEENPIRYTEGLASGSADKGGAPEWESFPQPENKFTTDTLHPKKSQ